MRQQHFSRLFLAGGLAGLLMLSGCGAPVKNWDPTGYTVQSGDTLYSIAWRYEIDPADLARWNKLSSPSLIYPGQRLRMRPPARMSEPEPVQLVDPEAEIITEVIEVTPPPKAHPLHDASAYVVVKKDDTLYSIARKHNIPVAQLIRANRLKKPYRIFPGQSLRLKAPVAAASHNVKTAPAVTAKPAKTITRKTRLTWQWPLRGKLIKRFNRHQLDARGIDIRARLGQPVKAAASGKVVYSGDGLIGYGNLVIIKHNNTYLSAYANNRKLLVSEGQTVKQGSVIAEVGKNASGTPVLHFEIRKQGKPVDPLRYLSSS